MYIEKNININTIGTFSQFNVSLLNKTVFMYKKNRFFLLLFYNEIFGAPQSPALYGFWDLK